MVDNVGGAILRRFDPDQDIPGLVQLRVEVEAHDQLGVDTSEATLRAQFVWPDHDPTQDRWVLETPVDGRLVGHAWTVPQSPLRAFVDVAVHPPGHPFVLARGFAVAGHDRFMTAQGDIQLEAPVWPTGFRLRSYGEINDLSILAEGSNRCYTDMWGHRENLVPANW